MRLVKMFGLAAIAAVAAIAAIGVGSSSADSFCTAVVNHKGEYPPGSVIALPVTIEATKVAAGKENDFATGEVEGAINVSCQEAKLKAKFTTNAGSHNQVTGKSRINIVDQLHTKAPQDFHLSYSLNVQIWKSIAYTMLNYRYSR